MKKLPIELFGGGDDELAPRSPVVWNGLEFSVCSELPFSIFSTVMRQAKQLDLSVSYNLLKVNIINHANTTLISDLRKWYKDSDPTVTELVSVAYQTKEMSNKTLDEATKIYRNHERLSRKIKDALNVFAKLKDGSLIHAGGKYEVKFNKTNYTYSFSRKILPPPTFSGDSSVSVVQDGKNVTINFDPTMTFQMIAGSGMYMKRTEQYSTLNLAGIVQGIRGINVKENRDHFLVTASDTLIASRSSELNVNFDINTGFRFGLTQEFLFGLNFRLYPGYGIEMVSDMATGKSIVRAAAISPKLEAGRNVTLIPQVVNGNTVNTYEVRISIPNIPDPPNIEAVWPVVASSQFVQNGGRNQLINNVTIDPDYSKGLLESIHKVNQSLVNTDTVISNITMSDFTSDTKTKFRCPILNLFEAFNTNGISQSSLATLPTNTAAAVEFFGLAAKRVDIIFDIHEAATTAVPGTGATLGLEFSFNAYKILENRIRTRTGNANFKIDESDYGTKYKLLGANLDIAKIANKADDDVLPLDYNMGWVETNAVASSGARIAFSAADYDFFTGVARNGQLNAVAVEFENNDFLRVRDGKPNYTIEEKVVSIDSASVVTNIKIKSSETGSFYEMVWSKPLTTTKSSFDNMTEISSGGAPSFVRLLARLIAEWDYDMKDAFAAVLALIDSEARIKTTNEKVFFDRLNDPIYAIVLGLTNAKGKFNLESISSITGEVVVVPSSGKLVRPEILASVNDLFDAARISLSFLVTPVTSADFDRFNAPCSWDNLSYSYGSSCSTISSPRTTAHLYNDNILFKTLTGKDRSSFGII